MNSKLVKDSRGIVLADAIVAILILTLFTGFAINLIYYIYSNSMFVKRNSTATGYAIQILEAAKIMPYSDIFLYYDDDSEFKEKIKTIIANGEEERNGDGNYTWKNDRYKAIVKVENYYPEGEEQHDFVKKVSVSVEYSIGKITKEVKMETMIGK